jgi:hypothetical protein
MPFSIIRNDITKLKVDVSLVVFDKAAVEGTK